MSTALNLIILAILLQIASRSDAGALFFRPTSWHQLGEFTVSGQKLVVWKPICTGALKVSDALTTTDVPPAGLYCVSHNASIIKTARSYDPRWTSVGRLNFAYGMNDPSLPVTEQFVTLGMIATTSRTEDLSTQDYAVFSRLCLTLCDDITSIGPISGNGGFLVTILTFNPFMFLGFFDRDQRMFVANTSFRAAPNRCLSPQCACDGNCVHGLCTELNKCDCDPHYTGEFCDEDINECELGFDSCDVLTECINLSPGYNCTPCPPGYIDTYSNGHKCIDIDECALNETLCEGTGYANCTNIPGSFICTNCPEKYVTDPWDPYACKELLCGNGVLDESEQCDGGVGCTPYCECKEPTWVPKEPMSIDCERRCGNLRMNTGEECEVGAGCNEFTCKCKRDLGFYPDDPPSLSCLRDVLNSTDECMSMATCDECIHINCLWCPSESLCLPSRTYSDCETACGVSPEKDPLLIEQEEEFTRKIIIVSSTVGGGLVLIIGVVIAWYVYRKRQLAKMGLTDDYELLTDDDTASNSRAQLLALLQHRAQTENNNKIDDNRIVSKYGIKRSEFHDTDLTNDWIPPADSKGVLLREMPIKISKEMLDFGKGLNQFKVGQAYEDRFTLSWPKQRGGKNEGINFQLHPPTSPKFTITFTPSQGTVKEDKLVEIRVKLVVNMTTEAEVAIGLQLPLHQVHSYMVFNVIGEMSTFIDFDEIQINRQLIIGDGAYGTVYRGKYRGQDVAIKVLKIQDMPDEMLDEFDREIDLMTKLRHKNIVQFVGASKVRGKLAIVTEFIELGNLTRLMDTCQLSYLIKLKIAVDAAKAVNFLHQNKILHRDLKPDNLLVVSLSPDPATVSVKLADFGTARAVSEKLANKYTMGIGTPMYMAPEIMAKTHYDLKADIYSFALILWALWLQKEPFTEFEHPWEIARHVLEGNRPIIPQDCPDAFRDLVTQCWATDPALRPTAEQLVTILETMFDEEIHKEVDKKRKRKEKKHGLLSASSRDNTATDLDTILLL